jgi:AraC-like DNA-binding protein
MGQASPGITPVSPPRVVWREFNSADEYADVIGLGNVRVNARVGDDFKASLMFLSLDDLRMRRGEASVGVSMAGVVADAHSFTFATRPAPLRLMSGREVADNVLYHPRPNELLTARTPSGEAWPWASIGLAYDVLDRFGPAIAGQAVSPSRLDASIVRAPAAERQRLLCLMEDAARVAGSTPEVFDEAAARRALSGAMLEALVGCLAKGDREPDRAAVRRHRLVMTRFERVLEERGTELLTMPDLCDAIGVAERSLQQVCHDFVGMRPMEYVRMRRLSLVRAALLAADPLTTKVSQVAMRHGFWELGRFSGVYRQRFGELPSETLRRTRR